MDNRCATGWGELNRPEPELNIPFDLDRQPYQPRVGKMSPKRRRRKVENVLWKIAWAATAVLFGWVVMM